MNQKPVTEADFAALAGKILLILPDPQIAYVSGGHLSTVLKADAYIRTIRAFLKG